MYERVYEGGVEVGGFGGRQCLGHRVGFNNPRPRPPIRVLGCSGHLIRGRSLPVIGRLRV